MSLPWVPYSNKIRIETGGNNLQEIQIKIDDVLGRTVYTTTTHEANYEFDTGNMAFGTYLLNIVIDGKKLVHKLIKGSF